MITSSTDRNTSFVDRIGKLISRASLHIADDAWVHFLQDHYTQLKENSTYVTLDEKTLLRFRYRISDYLTDKQYQLGIDQAFRVVNRLHSDLDFNLSLTGVYLPDMRYVSELRKIYGTNQKQWSSL